MTVLRKRISKSWRYTSYTSLIYHDYQTKTNTTSQTLKNKAKAIFAKIPFHNITSFRRFLKVAAVSNAKRRQICSSRFALIPGSTEVAGGAGIWWSGKTKWKDMSSCFVRYNIMASCGMILCVSDLHFCFNCTPFCNFQLVDLHKQTSFPNLFHAWRSPKKLEVKTSSNAVVHVEVTFFISRSHRYLRIGSNLTM